jgi:hypothetical protein
MAAYTLETSIAAQDLSSFYAVGANVVVAKSSMDGGPPNVAWVACRPSQKNTMKWVEEYGIYASTASLVNGALLTPMSSLEVPAQDGKTYPFTPDGEFGTPTQDDRPGSFYVFNTYTSTTGDLAFGLSQSAIVNGQAVRPNAISAATVPYNGTAQMTPLSTIYLWIQSRVLSNSVVTPVTSPMTKLIFGGGVTSVSLAYDSQQGVFVPRTNAALPAGLTIDQIAPSPARSRAGGPI